MTIEAVADRTTVEVVNPTADKLESAGTPLAPRLDTLDGKVLGLLSNSKPNAEIALRAVAEKIKETYPDLKIRLYPGSIRFEPELLRRAIEESDALIGATADCGACTSWLIHDGAQAEKAGVPQVTIVARGFERDTDTSAKVFGVPDLRYVVVPRVFTALTAEQAADQTLPLTDDIIAALTSTPEVEPADAGEPPAEEERQETYTFGGATAVQAIDAFNEYYLDHDYGDGLPLHAPTREKVEAIIAAQGRPRDELILTIPPLHGHGTLERIAVNAAMAGCRPEELPVVIAALKAIHACPPPMNLSVLMSTGAFAPVILVNGPLVKKLGINSGRSPLGPGSNNRVNIRIGRAVALTLRNLGAWIPGRMDLDTIGTVRKNIQVLGENEDESPWEPYQVGQGYRPDDSTVTVLHSVGEWDLGSNHGPVERRLNSIAARTPTLTQVGFMTSTLAGLLGNEDGLFYLLPPETAKKLSEAGLSKDAVRRYLLHNIRPRIADVIAPFIDFRERGLVRPEWEWMFRLSPEEQRTQSIQAFNDPDAINIAVAGHGTPKEFVFGTMTTPITEKIAGLG
ncbi:UGSC family (seleno)protein [Streptomyces hokutonensis]|uniref:UGSC family (seleno)protein n=1 Tax=Streptomyces hokutonensis TaxID=1306990 RepID=UPI00340E4EFF